MDEKDLEKSKIDIMSCDQVREPCKACEEDDTSTQTHPPSAKRGSSICLPLMGSRIEDPFPMLLRVQAIQFPSLASLKLLSTEKHI